jgi:preprotein translocase subunit SecG
MSIIIWLLTAILVVDCLFLMLLVLIQLPKKEAGLGQAFGSGTTDALFGAGSGNVLTKLTKYATVIFFAATLLISMFQGQAARAKTGDPRQHLNQDDKLATIPKAAPTNTAPAATTPLKLDTNLIQLKATGAAPSTAQPPAPPAPAPAPAPGK